MHFFFLLTLFYIPSIAYNSDGIFQLIDQLENVAEKLATVTEE
jgi:hypothetical protein